MGERERLFLENADGQGFHIARPQVLAVGGSDDVIRARLENGIWLQIHAGVYQLDRRPRDWQANLWAAVLAGGEGTLVSHRAALVLWRMEGITSAPVEVTVPYSNRPIPSGVVLHRTRRPRTEARISGLPVTSPERTILDAAAVLPRTAVAKAVESAIRNRLTTVDGIAEVVATKGGRGVRGTKKLRAILAERVADTSTGSAAETEMIGHLRAAGVVEPVLQHVFLSRSGRQIRPDFFWPSLNKAVEVDGLDSHASADRLENDLIRQNELLELGVELRRFSARLVRRDPQRVVAEIRRFLEV